MDSNKRKYLVYQITNRFDKKIYIGVHSTLNKNDRYFGSGVEIKEVLKKYGRKSFIKEILYEFDTKEEMLAKEKELVTKEFCFRKDTYNRIEGGGTYLTLGMVSVKDKNGNTSKVYLDDPRYLSGELVGVSKGTVTVKDKDNKTFQVNKNDERYLSGELVSFVKGMVSVKDRQGNKLLVYNNDPRWLSGELVGHTKRIPQHPNFSQLGKNHTQESKDKMSKKAKLRIGEKNSQFGSCWITKNNENKKIRKEELDLYLSQSWIKGRI